MVRIEDSGGKDREQQWRGLRAMMRVENVARVRVENVVRVGIAVTRVGDGGKGQGRQWRGSKTAVARSRAVAGVDAARGVGGWGTQREVTASTQVNPFTDTPQCDRYC